MFWPVIYLACTALVALFFRELFMLSRLPKGHPDRGLYWFNTFALILGAVAVFGVALYLDGRRMELESRMNVFPGAVFMPDRSVLGGGKVWLYTSTALPDDIERYYRAYASSTGSGIVVDRHDGILKLRIGRSSDPVYLSVTHEHDLSVLNYSLFGTTTVQALGE